MKSKLLTAALIAAVAAPIIPMTSDAQTRTYHGRTYRYKCKKSSGTTGLVAGGVGGAVVGNALGGGLLGTAIGAGGGALLGKHLDQKHDAAQNRKNGC